MRMIIGIAIVLLPGLASAGFYKWQSPDGEVYYSDRPVPGAQQLGLVVDQGSRSNGDTAPAEPDRGYPGPYESFEIITPEQNQTFRDSDGKVPVALLIDPALDSAYRVEILLNGHTIPGELGTVTQIELQGISFGSHRIQAQIRDDENDVIASSAPVDFHMRKPLPENLGL